MTSTQRSVRGLSWSRRRSRRSWGPIAGGVLALALVLGGLGATALEAAASSTIARLGGDIDGEVAGDQSGFSVALSSDGSRVAVGDPFDDDVATDAGRVRVFDWNGTAWVQVGDDIDGEAADDGSGYSVALSSDGSRVAVGDPFDDDVATDAGRVRVFDWNGAAWVQVGEDIDGEAAEDSSGYSVALSSDGSRVAIGAFGNGSDAGHVRVHDWNGKAWVQVGEDLDGEAAGDMSGTSVSLSSDGSRVAIGAPFNDNGSGSDAGHVRVYEYDSGASAWGKVGSDIDGEAAGDVSGISVALSADGSRVAIGALGNGSDAGHVRVYDWDEGASAWTQEGGDIDGEAAGDYSGTSVSLSSDGSRVAIGAPGNDENGSDAGLVRVYDLVGTAWVQVGGDVDGEAAGDESGYSVSVSSDGSRFAVGAPGNDENGSNAGHVRVLSIASAVASEVVADVVARLAVSCAPTARTVGATVSCTVTDGDPDIDVLWRAAYGPVFAEAGVELDGSGTGEFSFVVPAEAVGQVLTVELVEWTDPQSLGVVSGPRPSSVQSGGGPLPVRMPVPGWTLLMLVLTGGLVLRRVSVLGGRD